MSDTAAIITTAMTVLGGIIVAALTHYGQLRKSKREGVRAEDVQTQPVAAPGADSHEGWREAIAILTARAERAERALAVERDLRWAAIHYLRRVLEWVTRRFPDEQPPPPPDVLVDYLPPRKDPSS